VKQAIAMESGEGPVANCYGHNTTVSRGCGVVLSVIFLSEP
jgi:hypothetical protein